MKIFNLGFKIFFLALWLFIFSIKTYGQIENDNSLNVDSLYRLPIFNGGKNFEDGTKKFHCFVDNNINKTKLNSISIFGSVCVEFTIDSTGFLRDIKFLRTLDPIIDNELIRVLKITPLWKPGLKDGKPFSVPMNYCLKIPYENNNCH
jgi:hypothetical protein